MRLKGLMVLADGFEDTEALTTFDVLSRSEIEMTTVSLNDNLVVLSQYKHQILAHTHIQKINTKDYDFLVIPGGQAVMKVLDKSKEIDDLILDFVNKSKLVAAICAAPFLLGKLGLLKDTQYTCFPGFEKNIPLGNYQAIGVIDSKNFITGKSMYYTIDFALAIIKKLQGVKQKQQILLNLKGE